MKRRIFNVTRVGFAAVGWMIVWASPAAFPAEAPAGALAAFASYSATVESRLARQHLSPESFLAFATMNSPGVGARLREGELIIERISEPTPSSPATAAAGGLSGAQLHHWRGTAFAPGAKASDFDRVLRDFNSYPERFSPQVVQAQVIAQSGDRAHVSMRVRQHHVITVVMDTTYDVTFGRLDGLHGFSTSRSIRIAEIDSPGTATERTLGASEEHGFLWRQDTYWSYEERDGGLYLQVESISLSRAIPRGLGWALRPYVDSVPRESLEFTLHAACSALRK